MPLVFTKDLVKQIITAGLGIQAWEKGLVFLNDEKLSGRAYFRICRIQDLISRISFAQTVCCMGYACHLTG